MGGIRGGVSVPGVILVGDGGRMFPERGNDLKMSEEGLLGIGGGFIGTEAPIPERGPIDADIASELDLTERGDLHGVYEKEVKGYR